MADFGFVAVALAMVASAYAAVAFFLGARKGLAELTASARNAAIAAALLLSAASGGLFYALATHDFSLQYVADYTSRGMALVYLLSAFYAGNAGSLLLWAWILSLLSLGLLYGLRRRGAFGSYALSVMMASQLFFLLLLVFVSGPFDKSALTPADGLGLNPELENLAMVFHPPLVLLGYAAATLPFALALAALVTGRLGNDWAFTLRSWLLFGWLALSLGNLGGMWWAYVELGWGGYWSWDPVENASLMPWLLATALLHGAVLQRRRGLFRVWNLLLIIAVFELCIFGTFLTRSGVLSSVHAFSEGVMGRFLLGFMAASGVTALAFLYHRREQLRGEAELEVTASRETAFVATNLVLGGLTLAVFAGTISPLISYWAGGEKSGVGISYYHWVVGPLFLAVLLLMGLCPLLAWRRASISSLRRGLPFPLAVALAVVVTLLVTGVRKPPAVVGFTLAAFVAAGIAVEVFRGTLARRRGRAEAYPRALWRLLVSNRPRYGGFLVHVGILLLAVGIIGSQFYQHSAEAALTPGETMKVQDYTLTYEGLTRFPTATKEVVRATLSVSNGSRSLGSLQPERYFHKTYEQPVSEVAIRSRPNEDLYAILIDFTDDGRAAFRVLVNPLVMWIWVGAGVLSVGAVFAWWPSRHERPPQAEEDTP